MPKKSLKNISKMKLKTSVSITKVNPEKDLLNLEFIGKAILECLINNDSEGVMEVIQIYLETKNKSKLSKEKNIPRSTLYNNLKAKNPTIRTLAKYVSSNAKDIASRK